MITAGCQQFLVAKDEGSLSLAQATNRSYWFFLENHLPGTLLNYILLCPKRWLTGLHVATEDECLMSVGITRVHRGDRRSNLAANSADKVFFLQ